MSQVVHTEGCSLAQCIQEQLLTPFASSFCIEICFCIEISLQREISGAYLYFCGFTFETKLILKPFHLLSGIKALNIHSLCAEK